MQLFNFFFLNEGLGLFFSLYFRFRTIQKLQLCHTGLLQNIVSAEHLISCSPRKHTSVGDRKWYRLLKFC